ncbi:MAG: hypothetical protein Q4A21_00735 [bacterium]|nr:hypothetical protein [bacterium]
MKKTIKRVAKKTQKKMGLSKMEFIGWCGAVLFLLSYSLASLKIMKVESIEYQIMNLIGAAIAVMISLRHGVKQTATVNIVWAVVSVISIFNIIF